MAKKSEPKEQGFVDKLLHGDHGTETEAEAEAFDQESEKDKKQSPKSNDGDQESNHPKFDKFK